MDGQRQAGVVHAGEAAEEAGKTDRYEGMLAFGAVDRNQIVLVEHAESVEVKVAAEQRSVGGALLAGDDQR